MTFDEIQRIGILLIFVAIPILSGFTAVFIWQWNAYLDLRKRRDYIKDQIDKKLDAING